MTTDPVWMRAFRARMRILDQKLQAASQGSVRHRLQSTPDSYATQAAFDMLPYLPSLTGHERVRLFPELKAGLAKAYGAMLPAKRDLMIARLHADGLAALLPEDAKDKQT